MTRASPCTARRRTPTSGAATQSWPASAEEVSRPDADSHRFRLDLREVSTVGLDEGRKFLLIDIWKPGEAVRRIKRA